MRFGRVPVGVEGVLGIDWARRGCNGGVTSFLFSRFQLILPKNGCSLIRVPNHFTGSFSRSYRNGHINTIDLIFTMEHFLLSIIMHFFTSLTLLHLLLLTFSVKSIKLPLI